NKRSLLLDIKEPQSRDAFQRLIERADVLVHSMRFEAAKRAGIDYESVSAINPRIIYGYGPGYRTDGPLRNRPAYGDVMQAESGLDDLNWLASGEVRYFPTVIADKLCGHVLASAIVMALFRRERTGEGQCVEVPMLETMLAFNLTEHLWTGVFNDAESHLVYD